MRTILHTRFGSRLYGVEVAESDFDFRGVFVPSSNAILLQRISPTSSMTIDSSGRKHETEFIPLHTFIAALAKAESNSIDMLFSPSHAWLTEPHPVWKTIVSARSRLIGRNVRSLIGYSRAHAARFSVKATRLEAARTVVDTLSSLPPTDLLGDHSSAIDAMISGLSDDVAPHVRVIPIMQSSGRELLHLEACSVRSQYTSPVGLALRSYIRVLDEYGARAVAAASGKGVDWKAAMHATRIAQETVELLETGWITLPRPNRTELIRIRSGEVTLEEIGETLDALLDRAVGLTMTSTALGEVPDVGLADSIVAGAYLEAIELDQHRGEL